MSRIRKKREIIPSFSLAKTRFWELYQTIIHNGPNPCHPPCTLGGTILPTNYLFIVPFNPCIIFRTRLFAKLHLQVGLQVKPAVFGIRNDCKTGWSVSLLPPPSRFAQREKTSSQKTHTSTGLCLRSSRGSGLLLPFCLSLLNQVRLAFVFTGGFRMSSLGVERRLVVDTVEETGYESRITENL